MVVATRARVTRFHERDEVFGVGKGSFAEYAAAKQDKLSLKPPTVIFAQAAALPVSGLAALAAIDTARPDAAQHVLIVGASGGVGTHGVQIAKALGATVTGVASAAKLDLVRAVGADHALDDSTDDFTANGCRHSSTLVDVTNCIRPSASDEQDRRLPRARLVDAALDHPLCLAADTCRAFGLRRSRRRKRRPDVQPRHPPAFMAPTTATSVPTQPEAGDATSANVRREVDRRSVARPR
jgi:hypothetical protein